MMRSTNIVFCTSLLLAMLTGSVAAADLEDPALIRAAAESAVLAQAGVSADTLTLEVSPLDARLHVAACDRPLTAAINNASASRNQTTIGVHCEGSVRWTVYTSVSVESQASVLVARRSMARDVEVSPGDFTLTARRVPGLVSAYITDPAALAGQRLGRPIASGEPLTVDTLAPANLIHRGQQVVLLAHVGGLEVRMAGVALGDGRASDRIKVQNQSSQRVVEGIVRSANEIEIPL
jgi:flagella basal body P-ring formation protein FlgA